MTDDVKVEAEQPNLRARIMGIINQHATLALGALTLVLAPARVLVTSNFDTSTTLLVLSVADRVQLLSSTVLAISGPVATWILLLAVIGGYSDKYVAVQRGAPALATLAIAWLVMTQPVASLALAILGSTFSLVMLRKSGTIKNRKAEAKANSGQL